MARAKRSTTARARRGGAAKRSSPRPAVSRRDEIIEAAARLLIEQGFDAVSMRKIAAEVGLSSTALYLYFREKDELLDAVCELPFVPLAPQLAALLEVDAPVEEKLRIGLTMYLRAGLANPDHYRVSFLTRRSKSGWDHRAPLDYVDRWGHPRVNTFMYLVQGLRMGQEAGIVRHGDLMVLAESVLAAQHGLLALYILAPDQQWSDPDRLIATHVDMILRGLRPS
jgi:AcrR family transcriptional regulator